jgi:hypothetical protein
MEVAAIALELRREQDRIGLVDLMGCISSAAARTTNAPVSRLDLAEGVDAISPPTLQR